MRMRQRGVAIVLAMGVVALAAIAAAAIMVSQGTWARQVELTADHIQARAVLLAGADWARAVLSDDRRVSNVDHLGEPWALRLPPMSVENGELVGHIEDQQGAFNVNNLVADGKVNVAQLAHFREARCLHLRTERKPEIRAALHQESDASIDFSLLGFGQGVPPLLELIGVLDFPHHD